MLSRFNGFATCPGRPRAGRLLVACGLFIGLVLAASATWYIVLSRQTVIDGAVREMRNDALMLAEQEDRLLQAVGVVQIGLIEHMRGIGIDSPEKFEQLMASQAAHQNLRDRIAGAPYMSALSLSDRHGTLLNFSRGWPPPPVNSGDRDFIRELTSAGAPQTFISEPMLSETTGLWTLFLSRRFEAADGRLIGFVLSTIEIDYFEQFFARLPLTGGGSFGLWRRDGMLLARYPHVDPKIGKMFAATINFSLVLHALDNGTIRQHSVLDGKDRLIVPRAMVHFPLIITVSDTMASILRRWTEEMRIIVATTALLELMIAGTILLALRHLRGRERLLSAEAARARAETDLARAEERERGAQTLHRQELRFDTAVHNMMQGLIMVDHAGTVLAANRRFLEFSGLTADSLPRGTSYARLIELVLAAGTSKPEDLIALRRRREEAIALGSRATFIWERVDGRAFTVTHQPTEEGWLSTYEDVTERRTIDARIAHLAQHDALTGLPNRVLFHQMLDRALAFARRGHLVALHFLDLDQFKAVNDTLGHPIGDGLLQAVAERLRRGLRETDMVARLGGDEFAIVQPLLESAAEAIGLASRMINLIETPFDIEGHQIAIGTSIGIALAPDDGPDADQLLKNADLALYRAKADGRGVYRLFRIEMDAAMQARRVLELELRQALHAGQLELLYQPLIDVQARRVAGCEALLRWRHTTKGLLPPDQFLPLAEETGVIVPLGEWVLRQACADAVEWPGEMKVAVDLSAVQFKNRNLVGAVAAALRESGLPASRLELEITETVMLLDIDATLATLRQLRELGVQIALDDFGNGCSSLSYLRRFPFDRIKIDQAFVSELCTRRDCSAIVRALTALGHDLGTAVTAEGVETRQQFGALEQAGCAEIQGLLFGRPVPASMVTDMLRSMPIITDARPRSAAAAAAGSD